MAPTATVARSVRALYVDLDGTLLGPGGSLFAPDPGPSGEVGLPGSAGIAGRGDGAGDGAGGGFSLDAVRALQACARADVEVVIYSGRRQASVFEDARLLGQTAYIFELGCGLVVDGELEWLTDGLEPSADTGTIHDQIEASGAPELLLERFAGRLEYHTPWSAGRDVSHLFRGEVDLREAASVLEAEGLGWLRLVDNGVLAAHGVTVEGSLFGLAAERVHAYHLIPAGASKARAVARHMQGRGYSAADCIAAGDSREDMDAASVVGCFWMVANGPQRDPSLRAEIAARSNVRVAEAGYGAGVYEAVVTTLAGG